MMVMVMLKGEQIPIFSFCLLSLPLSHGRPVVGPFTEDPSLFHRRLEGTVRGRRGSDGGSGVREGSEERLWRGLPRGSISEAIAIE